MINDSKDWQSRFQDKNYLDLCISRLDDEVLKWCIQFASLINNEDFNKENLKLNDIGCNVGHFCRILGDLRHKFLYEGYDISETYLSIAKEKFPNLIFTEHDIVDGPPRECDLSVVSATLEHIQTWEDAIKNIFESTTQVILLRSFFGEIFREDQCKKEGAVEAYPILQLKFSDVAEVGREYGFATTFLRDSATDSIPKYLGCGITRTQYIALMRKV